MSTDRFYVQHPHITGEHAVIDHANGALVYVSSEESAQRVVDVLTALLVHNVDLHWYCASVAALNRREMQTVLKHLQSLVHSQDNEMLPERKESA
jgi:hypothetical protein